MTHMQRLTITKSITKLLCQLGLHQWKVRDHPFLGRRNLTRIENGVALFTEGPEEMFYPGKSEGVPLSRFCQRCRKVQIHLGRFGWC